MNLSDLILEMQKRGYKPEDANARVCQDIVLKAISQSALSRNVTIKGGVVMRSLTDSIRRATQDMDIDFIRYSLSEESITRFIEAINCLNSIHIQKTGKTEELNQQDYKGKRIHIQISDEEVELIKEALRNAFEYLSDESDLDGLRERIMAELRNQFDNADDLDIRICFPEVLYDEVGEE